MRLLPTEALASMGRRYHTAKNFNYNFQVVRHESGGAQVEKAKDGNHIFEILLFEIKVESISK